MIFRDGAGKRSASCSWNASVFVKEGLGYQLTFKDLVDVSKNSGLTFRPLYPQLETKLYLIWNKYQKD